MKNIIFFWLLFRKIIGVFMKHNEIKELISIFDESDITKLKINDKEFSITLEKGTLNISAPINTSPVVETVAPVAVSTNTVEYLPPEDVKSVGDTINSPMVGTFYIAPGPGAAPFVKAGDTVTKGQTVAIVEAMKIMNEIEAEFDCKIIKVLIEDGQPVEFGTPLFEVEKL